MITNQIEFCGTNNRSLGNSASPVERERDGYRREAVFFYWVHILPWLVPFLNQERISDAHYGSTTCVVIGRWNISILSLRSESHIFTGLE